MEPNNTALILIGFQNDYFAKNGILRGVLENDERADNVLRRTVSLIDSIKSSGVTIFSTPIIFSSDYSEILQSDGILSAIKDANAFKEGATGSETVDEIKSFGDRIIEIPGKRGLNAFMQTDLEKALAENEIKNVIFAGVVTSICIDSTARAAYEYGYRVIILDDCTAGRTDAEQDFFCGVVFPTYATVSDSKTIINWLTSQSSSASS
ncbi:MAG: cysteine hydrolase [Phycisphaerae bacterium]|jgi:nicotinamidase-related amidase|nr:cysteine hydrolase [Phycisphaerae bacterium]